MTFRSATSFALRVGLAAAALYTVPWLIGAARAATGDAVVPPPTPDALIAYVQSYGWIVGGLTVIYVSARYLLKKNDSTHWLAQGRALAIVTTIVGVGGTALQAFTSGTPWSGVLATAVLGLLHLADSTVTPATKQAGFARLGRMMALSAVGIALVAGGCGASQRETTIRTSVAAADGIRDTFLAYDGPHELDLARSGPATPEGKAAAAAALAAYQAKRSATIDKAMIVVYRAIAVAATLNDQPSLDGIKSALDQLNAAYKALKGTTP